MIRCVNTTRISFKLVHFYQRGAMRILLLVLTILIIACKENAKNHQKVSLTKKEQVSFSLDTSQYVILTFQDDWYWIFENVQSSNLSSTELIKIEKIIDKALEENNELQKQKLKTHNANYPSKQRTETGYELKVEGFKRQYVPVINEKGEKEIWVNFFCNDWRSEKWKTDIMFVHDGGNCYFNLKVNLATKTYSELHINGYA
jgi:hypothetical protein